MSYENFLAKYQSTDLDMDELISESKQAFSNDKPVKGSYYLRLLVDKFKHFDSMIKLAHYYLPKNIDKSIEFIEMAQKYPIKPNDYFRIGYYYDLSKDIDNMIKWYLISIEHECYTAAYNLAYYYDEIGNFDSAVKYYLIAGNGGYMTAFVNLGQLYLKSGDIQNCFKYTKIAASKNEPHAHYNIAVHYFNISDFDNCIKYCEMAPDDDDCIDLLDEIYDMKN